PGSPSRRCRSRPPRRIPSCSTPACTRAAFSPARWRWPRECASCCPGCAAGHASPPRRPFRTRTRSALSRKSTAWFTMRSARSLVTPVAAQTVSVARGVESHASLAPIAARRAHEALEALKVLIAVELVTAVRALRLAGHEPTGAGARALYDAATPLLDPELA